MPYSIAVTATAATLLWLATVPWFDHAPFLLRLIIAAIVVVVTMGAAALVRPGRGQQP